MDEKKPSEKINDSEVKTDSPEEIKSDVKTGNKEIKILPAYYEKNRYLIILYKKIRALKKKLEKCKKVEERSKEKNVELHKEQLVLLNSKDNVEKSLKDFETLRSQFEEIAKEEYEQEQKNMEQEQTQVDQQENIGEECSLIDDNEDDVNKYTDQSQQTDPLIGEDAATQAEVQTEEVFTSTNEECLDLGSDSDADRAAGVGSEVTEPELQMEEESPANTSEDIAQTPLPVPAPLQAPAPAQVVDPTVFLESGVGRVLQLLHLANCYSPRTGLVLPGEVNFLSKVLMGKTAPPDEFNFDQTLQQSVKIALLYIRAIEDKDGNSKIMGVPMTGMDITISELVAHLNRTPAPRVPPPPHPTGPHQNSPLPAPQPTPENPPINFLAQPSPSLTPVAAQVHPEPLSVSPPAAPRQAPPVLPQPHQQVVSQAAPAAAHSQQLVQEAVAAGGWHHPGPAPLHSLGGLGLGPRPPPRPPSPHQVHPADVMGGLVPPFHPFPAVSGVGGFLPVATNPPAPTSQGMPVAHPLRQTPAVPHQPPTAAQQAAHSMHSIGGGGIHGRNHPPVK